MWPYFATLRTYLGTSEQAMHCPFHAVSTRQLPRRGRLGAESSPGRFLPVIEANGSLAKRLGGHGRGSPRGGNTPAQKNRKIHVHPEIDEHQLGG
jgi:hypothetical protein